MIISSSIFYSQTLKKVSMNLYYSYNRMQMFKYYLTFALGKFIYLMTNWYE